MIRRTALAAAAAVAIILAPTAAMAYETDEFTAVVDNASPAAGTPVSVSVQGPPNSPVTLTVTSATGPDSAIQIAGTAIAKKDTSAAGTAVFTVTLSQGGAYTAVAKDAAGNVLLSQELNVAAAAASGTSTSATAASKAVASGEALAETGLDGAGLATGAGALVLAGAGAVMVAKRRQSAHVGA